MLRISSFTSSIFRFQFLFASISNLENYAMMMTKIESHTNCILMNISLEKIDIQTIFAKHKKLDMHDAHVVVIMQNMQ